MLGKRLELPHRHTRYTCRLGHPCCAWTNGGACRDTQRQSRREDLVEEAGVRVIERYTYQGVPCVRVECLHCHGEQVINPWAWASRGYMTCRGCGRRLPYVPEHPAV